MVKETYKSQVHDVKNKPPFWQLMPKACSLDAQGLFTRCPRLVHSMPKACSSDAQGLFTRCPRLVHPMPKACSSDAHPLLCKQSPLQSTAD